MTCDECTYYVDGKCADYDEYVDQETGEDTCRYHPNAIDKESYEEEA